MEEKERKEAAYPQKFNGVIDEVVAPVTPAALYALSNRFIDISDIVH